jgi:hypothetical protein
VARVGVVLAGALAALAVAAEWDTPAQAQDTARSCPSGIVALTFDDGPDTHTGAVLDELAAWDVPATFFVLGMKVVDQPALVQRAANEGHDVANHSYSHRDLEELPYSEVYDEIGGFNVEVNQSPHWNQLQATENPLYARFYERISQPTVEDVLVIGSGSGNDLGRGWRGFDRGCGSWYEPACFPRKDAGDGRCRCPGLGSRGLQEKRRLDGRSLESI